jgi:hypothetical protein
MNEKCASPADKVGEDSQDSGCEDGGLAEGANVTVRSGI